MYIIFLFLLQYMFWLIVGTHDNRLSELDFMSTHNL